MMGPPPLDASDAREPEAGTPAQASLDPLPGVGPDRLTTVAAGPALLDAAVLGEHDASSVDAEAPAATARARLVTPERWQLLDADHDPFVDRPAAVDCSAAGVVAETLSEERVLGVETGSCNYLTALQPSQRAVQPGHVIKVRLWHFELSAPEPAEAHVALHIAGIRVLDERVAIPQPGGLLVKQLTVEQAIPAGSPVHFHLHNHGANSWALVEVSTGPAPPM